MSLPRPAIVLLSGGLDSATCLAIAVQQGFAVHAISFRYGQRHQFELQRAAQLADAAAVSHSIVDINLAQFGGSALTDESIAVPKCDSVDDIGDSIPVTYVPARNTVFLSLALALAETLAARDIFIGVNALDYSGYPDCRAEFIEAFEEMANLATKAGIEAADRLKNPHTADQLDQGTDHRPRSDVGCRLWDHHLLLRSRFPATTLRSL
jgi:7-cyano-7-deazaguanine synthase